MLVFLLLFSTSTHAQSPPNLFPEQQKINHALLTIRDIKKTDFIESNDYNSVADDIDSINDKKQDLAQVGINIDSKDLQNNADDIVINCTKLGHNKEACKTKIEILENKLTSLHSRVTGVLFPPSKNPTPSPGAQ